MNKELKLGKNILILSITTLLTVCVWIGFEVYRTYTRTTVPKIIRELIAPLDPILNETIIEEIEKKYQPSAAELDITTAPIIPGPTATPSGGLD